MSKVAKWIFPAAGGKDGIIGTAKAVVGIMTGNWGMIASGVAQVAGMGKKAQGQARQASVLQLTLGETPREAVLGQTCTGGSLVDVFNFGGQYKTDKVTRCVALADHAIDGIVGFYIDETYYPWVGEGLQAAFSNKLSFHFRNASPTGHAPPQHVMENGGWVATDRMVGITHIWIDWYVDEKVWPQGHPSIRFVLRGLRAYDPRFDPQFGYSGPYPQTWEDRSSHRFTRNAKVLRYAYTRGIYAEGHHGDPNYLLIGRGLSAEEAPPAAVIADANLCDEVVDGVPRYTVGGVISAAQPFIDVDGMFAAAMAGVIVQREGTVDVEAGQAKAVVVTITDDDLVVGESVSFSRFLPDNDGGRINTVMGRYIEPALGFKDHSAPVRRSLEDIQADGGPREQTVSLPLVDEVKQADRIIEIQRLLGRLERRASIVLPPKFAGLEEGDWIAWQSQRRHGGATVRYRIETYRQPETWRMYLTLREIASSVFGVPDPIEDLVIPPPAPIPLDALSLLDVTAEAITLPGETSTLPAIRIRWTAPVDAAVLAIRAEVRRVGETEAAPTRTEDVNTGELVTTNGVGADLALEARLVPIGDPSRPVLPSNWITLSTAPIRAGDVALTAPTIIGLQDQITTAFGDIFDVSGLVADARADIDAQGVEIAAARGGQPNLNSRILELNQARIDGDEANAQAISLVQARTENTEAGIIDLENALATETGARSEQISEISARLRQGSPNLLPGGDFYSLQGWYYLSGAWQAANYPTVGRYAYCSGAGEGFRDITGDFGGKAYSLSAEFEPTGRCYLQFWSAGYGAFLGGSPFLTTTESFKRVATPPTLAPSGTAIIRVVKESFGPEFGIARVAVQNGPATDWRDDETVAQIGASVTQQSLAIVDLENQQNIALWRIKAEASGSRPAIIEAYSGLGASAVAISAEQIYLGDNTVFDDLTNTWQTIDGSTVYIRAEGEPFGAFSNLREWWGPTGIALGAMTPDNGYSGRMTTAPYNFTNTLNPKTFSAYASPGSIVAHRASAGSLTSAAVSILYQNAKGAVTVTWERLIGGVTAAGTAAIDAPDQLTTTFTKTVSAQERTDTVFQATLTDAGSGERRQVIVPVVFTSGSA
ncbi:phage tail protein [Brevundimonas bullata]|uniref:phage tail protein n=1 Tax=Brevundimonas bullata TaxID=13160 RepID=UPI002FD9AE89